MKFRHFVLITALATSTAFAQQPKPSGPVDATLESLRETVPAQTDPTAAQLFATSIRARGGANKVRVQSIQADVKYTSGPDVTEIQMWAERPEKVRTEYHFRKLGKDYSVTRGVDANGAWIYDTTKDRPFPQDIGGNEKKQLLELAPKDDLLVTWEQEGCVLEYLGPINSRKQKHYLVKLYHPDGMTEYFYFHAKNYLLTRHGKKEINQGVAVDTDVHYVKYENFDGLWFPTKLQNTIAGEAVMDIELTNVRLNQPIDDSIFAMPETKEVWLRGQK